MSVPHCTSANFLRLPSHLQGKNGDEEDPNLFDTNYKMRGLRTESDRYSSEQFGDGPFCQIGLCSPLSFPNSSAYVTAGKWHVVNIIG